MRDREPFLPVKSTLGRLLLISLSEQNVDIFSVAHAGSALLHIMRLICGSLLMNTMHYKTDNLFNFLVADRIHI